MSLYTVIGVMSGTSMDGIDITFSSYEFTEKERCKHITQYAETFAYTSEILEKLKTSTEMSATELILLDKLIGRYFAECTIQFITQNKLNKESIDAIASHGHTIFHQPELGYTHQIGCGDTISALTGIKVINDFRQKDVITGGQGAPLVPIGDKMIYGHLAEAFLNIGGFCNISIPSAITIAYDICPGNLPLNAIALNLGLNYDSNGDIASSGEVDSVILEKLNALDFYTLSPPKSLGTEWIESEFTSIIDQITSKKNRMRTVVEHISDQIANACEKHNLKSIYITGGGVYNSFLISRIKNKTEAQVIIPSANEVEFKEAIIFGLLGALYLDNRPNCLASVTGASKNVTGGVLHMP